MSDIAIRVEGLGKRYRLGANQQQYGSLRESLSGLARAPIRAAQRIIQRDAGKGSRRPEFWALKDVSFEVKHGESLGIIGRNGAGKSTLLKLLSEITEPTEGRIAISGRVASLLEVGTGFHPELTGRENIYLNGAILGMTRREIAAKFDEIVAFAEVEKFIDTQVKRYSSGMYLRLAFAVAAHLEPEILVVDEVLAVGDSEFQKKCLGKMGDVSRHGRTVLFVSHNMGAIRALCTRAVLLCTGRNAAEGPTEEVVATYVSSGAMGTGETVWPDLSLAPGTDAARLHAVRVISGGICTADVDIEDAVEIQIEYWNLRPDARITCSIHLLDSLGGGVLASANLKSAMLGSDAWAGQPHPMGLFRSSCVLPGNFLNEGPYAISAFVLTDVANVQAQADSVVSFTVHETGGMRKEFQGSWLGVVRPRLAWSTEAMGTTVEAEAKAVPA